MRSDLLASIIIDNYNYGRFIGEAINSALNQNYENIEVIVVDDGSTDNSRSVIDSFGAKVIPVYKSNGGQASALNAGFDKSKGDIIFFLDSDDLLFNDTVSIAMSYFSSVDVSKVQWPLLIVDEDGTKTGGTRPSALPAEGDYKNVILEFGPTSCVSSPTSGNAWNRSFLKKVFPIPEDVPYYKTCADEYMYTLAPVFGSIKTILKPQGYYRIHGKNIYSALSFDAKLQLELDGHVQQTKALSKVLRKNGYQVNKKSWKENSWFHLLKAALDDIREYIPVTDKFILVDDNAWNANETFADNRAKPFLEVGGVYNGIPQNDAEAIRELDRLRLSGVKYIVFAKHSYWWFDNYPQFTSYLFSEFECKIKNERAVIIDLKK
jgi:glycosyltransferase involved in cell wall biosynthesis